MLKLMTYIKHQDGKQIQLANSNQGIFAGYIAWGEGGGEVMNFREKDYFLFKAS